MSIASGLLRSALDLLLPRQCLGCGANGTYLCERCADQAERPQPELPPESGPLAGVLAPFAYRGVGREAVRRLKYRGARALAPDMARPMTRELALAAAPPFALVPAPLHPKRLRERGYNQAELLAREVARALDAPLLRGAIKRAKDTPPQVSMANLAERLENVRGAFAPAQSVDGGTVIVVDDVATTGATLTAAAQALRDAGASRVYGLAFARDSGS